MRITSGQARLSGFHELSPRARLAALLDEGECIELVGPFDSVHSPWLLQQGLVPQSDDGVIVVRGAVDGQEVIGIAIEGGFEGGSIGEVGGAKITCALQLAAQSCREGRPLAALLLLESGGVRLQEATLGLAAIASIQSAIMDLRQHAPVVVVIAGPIGCFGGMSLAAELCTYIVGTPHGRLGMNGPEVIEQEAGADEIDASDRNTIWKLVGCEARCRDGWIDAFVPDESQAIAYAVRQGIVARSKTTARLSRPAEHLQELRREFHQSAETPSSLSVAPSRGSLWLERLSDGNMHYAFETPSVLTANVKISGAPHGAFAISIVPDAGSRFPRAASGEFGLEQAWALAACIEQFVAAEQRAGTCRPIVAIVDTVGQAFGRIEEQRCISAAAAAAIEAYAAARAAGHVVLTLVAGRAVSGAFLAHGFQSDHIFALTDEQVSLYAMSAQSIARITRRTVDEVKAISAAVLPMSFDIHDAYRLGVIHTLIEDVNGDDPSPADIAHVKFCFAEALAGNSLRQKRSSAIMENPHRSATRAVYETMHSQWNSINLSAAEARGSEPEPIEI